MFLSVNYVHGVGHLLEFHREVDFADDAPSIGGEDNDLKWMDKNLLIVFPHSKMLLRTGRLLEREFFFKFDKSTFEIKKKN